MGFLTQGANCQNSSSIRPFDADRRKGRGPGLFLPAAEVETQDKRRGNDKFCCFGVGTVDVFDVTKCVFLQLWSAGLIVLSQFGLSCLFVRYMFQSTLCYRIFFYATYCVMARDTLQARRRLIQAEMQREREDQKA